MKNVVRVTITMVLLSAICTGVGSAKAASYDSGPLPQCPPGTTGPVCAIG